MKCFAFVFARGGSKGLPRKNIRPLQGKPLINYSIETAFATPEIERVFVSTDDAEISAVASAAGAIVIERPAQLATDESPEWLSWQHAVSCVRREYGYFDCFVSLPATSPLRAVKDVQAAIQQFNDSSADVCISVTDASRNPYFNMVKVDKDNTVSVVCADKAIVRRQDAPEVFDITTVAYVTSPDFIMQAKRLFDGQVVCVKVPKERAVDIDDIYDFMFAECLLRGQSNVT